MCTCTLVYWYFMSTPTHIGRGGSNGNGAGCGMVTIVEIIDHRPYIVQPPVYGRLIYTIISVSDRLFT